MAAPSGGWWQRRGLFGLYELLQSWWRHRVSFIISLVTTLAALTIYYFTFSVKDPRRYSNSSERLEYNSLDTRFRYRPANATHRLIPRIVIVDVDQRFAGSLGQWPFSRTHFAKTAGCLMREDGAKVAAFDITFHKPDQTVEPLRKIWPTIWSQGKKQESRSTPSMRPSCNSSSRKYDADAQFAKAIDRFGPVVLGSFFLKRAELTGIDDATLDQYADLIDWYSYSKHPPRSSDGKARLTVELAVRKYDPRRKFIWATAANIPASGKSGQSWKNIHRLLQHCGRPRRSVTAGDAGSPVRSIEGY